MIMKKLLQILTAAVLGTTSNADPLDKSQIAGDAKWLAHLDMQEFEHTVIGEYLISFVKEEIAKKDDSPVTFDVNRIVQELHSLTAYGSSMAFDDGPGNSGVLIAKTGSKARAIIDAYIASEEIMKDGKTGIKRLEDKDYLTYLIGNEVYLSFPQEGLLISSKEFDQIERALNVIKGQEADLNDSDSKLILSDEPGFFFLATINGIDTIKGVPPQAKILQKAKGGQFSLGERDSSLRSNIVLSTAGPEVSNQLSRIIQGMVALASFADIGGESLADLMDSVSVDEGHDRVSIDLEYPVGTITNILTAIATDHPEKDKKHSDSAEE